MRRFFSNLVKSFRTTSSARGGRRAPPRAALQVEGLEQRDVPTVAFLSNWGYETIHGSVTDGMKNPPVVLLFSGNYWNSMAGGQDMTTLKNSAVAIMSGPYLSDLTEYGSDGQAHLAQSKTITDTVTINNPGKNGQADDVKLNGLLDNAIDNEGALKPGNNDWQHAPIYVVISDPSSSQGSTVGHNSMGHYPQTGGDNIHMIWMSTSMGTDGHVIKNQWTDQFGHELVETLSDPDSNGITITPPDALPNSLRATGNLQIGDDEPDNMRYTWSLDGNVVQAYWSARNHEFIVPDHNTQLVILMGNWTGTTLNNFTLYVNGGQLGVNDTISLDNSGGSVRVTLNQESFVCVSSVAITAVYVNTDSGTNKVQVNALPASVKSLSLDTYDATDAITIGNGTLAGISPGTTIDISNMLGSGQSSVFINGYQGAPANVNIDGSTIHYNGLTSNNGLTINYDSYMVNGRTRGVTSLGIDTPNGSSIYAAAVVPSTTITVYVSPSDPVNGPAAGQLNVVRRWWIYFPPPPVSGGQSTTNALTF
jgi:hypothetical protein